MKPDQMVEEMGETVTVKYVEEAEFDTDYNLDTESSTINTFETKAIVSNPSRSTQRRMEGRGVKPRYEVTVTSDSDIDPGRQGRPDRIEVRGEWLQVEEEQLQEHPMTGTKKKLLVLSGLHEGV